MKKDEILEKVKYIFKEELEIDESALLPEARLKEDLGIDSLDFVDIVVFVDEHFHIKLVASDFAGVRTFAELCHLLDNRING